MTRSTEPRRPPERHTRSRSFHRRRIALGIGGVALVGLVGGAGWAWVWIHQRLAPLVESNLSQLLNRPVELGAVEGVGFSSIQFGRSVIPPIPEDPDRVTVETVQVNFALLPLLFTQTLQLDVVLIEPNGYIEQSADGQWISTQIQSEEEDGGGGLLTTELQSIRLQDADLVLDPQSRPNVPDGVVRLKDVDGVVQFLDDNERIVFNAQGDTVRGGRVRVAGESIPAADRTELRVRAQNLPAVNISRLIDLPVAFQAGRVDGNVTVQLQPGDEPPNITGRAILDNAAAQIAELPQRFTRTNGRLRFQGEAIALDNLRTRYGEIPAQVAGVINLETGYDLTAETIQSVPIEAVLDTFETTAGIPLEGNLAARLEVGGALQEPVLEGIVSTATAAQIDQVDFREITAQFRLTTAGDAPVIRIPDLLAFPQAGGRVVGSAQIQLGDTPNIAATLRALNVPGDEIAQSYDVSLGDIAIGEVTAGVQLAGSPDDLQTLVQFRLPEATYPGQGELLIADGGTLLLRDAQFTVAGGTVEVAGRLADGQFQATVDAAAVGLNPFSEDLRGRLSAMLRLSGPTEDFQLSALRAAGQVRFSEGLAVVQEPLTALVQWTGDQLVVERATAPGLTAQGTVDVRVEGAEAPQIGGFNLAVQAQDYDLQDLGLNLPGNVALLGQADFDGRVTGTPSAPRAVGALQVQNLQVDGLAFAPLLTGQVDYQAGQRTDLQLAGGQDRLALTLGPNNRPESFLVQQDEAIAQGQTRGDTLFVDLQQIPLALVEGLLPQDNLAISPVAGDISGELAVNLDTFNVRGDVAIASPALGPIAADTAQVQFEVTDGVVTVTEGVIQQGEGRIALGGTIPFGQAQPVDFRITLEDARVQNLLQALNLLQAQGAIEEIPAANLGDASDLQTIAIDVTELSLINKLRRLAEIEAILALQAEAEPEPEAFPPVTALQGTVNGAIAFSGLLDEGLDIRFDLLGQDWTWGQYPIDTVVAEGNFQDGVLTADPVRVDVGEGLLAFTGQFGEEQLTGELRTSNLPLELLDPLLANLPVEVDGQLDAIADLSGSLDNPAVAGTLVLEAAQINEQPIERAAAQFAYNDAQLNFTSDILVAGTEPIDIVGTVPIALPFAEAQPTSDQISIRTEIEDEGLAIVNVFTDQIRWVDGDGRLALAVGGTLDQPQLEGVLTVQEATLQAQILEDPLTNVTGTIQVEADQLQVERLVASYNEGQLVAQGAIPIFTQQVVDNPLEVALADLTVDVNGLYEGGVRGDVVLTGAVLEPVIGGTVQLTDGEVSLGGGDSDDADADPNEEDLETVNDLENEDPVLADLDVEEMRQREAVTTLPELASGLRPTPVPEEESAIAFNDLQLILGEDVQVTNEPILSFEVTGDLTVNGSLSDLRPDGVIELIGGQINLFTTRFVLDQGYEQTVVFTPEAGINPILDVQLFALVPEAVGSFVSQSPTTAYEIADTPDFFGTVRTVRVEASITGYASELSQNLELSSDPDRTDAEIVSLLGGNFLTTFEANPALGAATFAGSALFGNDLQAVITELRQAVGLSELRVFPTFVAEEDETQEASALGLSVEGIVDVTEDFSVSVAGIVGAEDPIRYSVIYRINEELLLRTSTDLAGDSRATLRYEIAF